MIELGRQVVPGADIGRWVGLGVGEPGGHARGLMSSVNHDDAAAKRKRHPTDRGVEKVFHSDRAKRPENKERQGSLPAHAVYFRT